MSRIRALPSPVAPKIDDRNSCWRRSGGARLTWGRPRCQHDLMPLWQIGPSRLGSRTNRGAATLVAALTDHVTACVQNRVCSHTQKFPFSISRRVDWRRAELFTTALSQPHHKAYLINGLGPEAFMGRSAGRSTADGSTSLVNDVCHIHQAGLRK